MLIRNNKRNYLNSSTIHKIVIVYQINMIYNKPMLFFYMMSKNKVLTLSFHFLKVPLQAIVPSPNSAQSSSDTV